MPTPRNAPGLTRGQLTLEQLFARRERLVDIERRELAAMHREQARENAEATERRKRRAVEAAAESVARGSMRLPKLVKNV